MSSIPKSIGRLIRVPLREIWRHEAQDFTRWLADHLDEIEEVTGLSLTLIEREAATGSFAVDILAEDGEGSLVVIENQLEANDHDHLGKLITYMSNQDAKIAIWITSDPRPEHERAVEWLNETLPADAAFYLIKVEAVRINDSPPAPLFTVVAAPSLTSQQVGEQRKELAQRHKQYLEFWAQLLDKARGQSNLFSGVSPKKDHWISAGAGRTGVQWSYVALKDHARVELYIDTTDSEKNKQIFDALSQYWQAIEASFGSHLVWQRLDNKRASRISHEIHTFGGISNYDQWDALQTAMVEAMDKLENALKPHLAKLPKT